MKNIFIIILSVLVFGCASTTKKEYIELPSKIKKEYVYIECNIPEKLLSTNKITIKEEKLKEFLKKVAIELKSRKQNIEKIKNIDCIKVIKKD